MHFTQHPQRLAGIRTEAATTAEARAHSILEAQASAGDSNALAILDVLRSDPEAESAAMHHGYEVQLADDMDAIDTGDRDYAHGAQFVQHTSRWQGEEVHHSVSTADLSQEAPQERPQARQLDVEAVAISEGQHMRHRSSTVQAGDVATTRHQPLQVAPVAEPFARVTGDDVVPGMRATGNRFDPVKYHSAQERRQKAADKAAFPYLFDDSGRRANLSTRQWRGTMAKVRARMATS